MSSVFLVVEPRKIIPYIKCYTPKRRIQSYSIMGTIVSPNKILLLWNAQGLFVGTSKWGGFPEIRGVPVLGGPYHEDPGPDSKP